MLSTDWYTSLHRKYEKLMLELLKYKFTFKPFCPLCLNIIQIMPGLEGDLVEWQTQEVNVTRGEAEGDIDLEGLPFLKVTRGHRHYLFCYSQQFYFFMHILVFTISIQTH